jgi:hypothetical protein
MKYLADSKEYPHSNTLISVIKIPPHSLLILFKAILVQIKL